MVAVTIDTAQMAKLERAVGHLKRGVPRALTPAINRALSSGQTAVRREIRKEYVIKQKDIPTKIKRATYGGQRGEIRIEQGMLPLSKFFYSGGTGRRPLFARVRKSGGGVIGRGFVYRGPYMRTGDPRLPIRKIMTIGAPIMATQPAVGPAANKAMGDTLAKRIDHEIKRVMASAGGTT